MTIEIVDLSIENGDFPVRYVKLPEGIYSGRQRSIKMTQPFMIFSGSKLLYMFFVFFGTTYKSQNDQPISGVRKLRKLLFFLVFLALLLLFLAHGLPPALAPAS